MDAMDLKIKSVQEAAGSSIAVSQAWLLFGEATATKHSKPDGKVHQSTSL